MQKITVGVYKSYKTSGNLRFPKANTKKHWKHYYIEIDEDATYFGSEWVSALKAVVLKRKQLYKKTFWCHECEEIFTTYVKKNQTECECTNCGD